MSDLHLRPSVDDDVEGMLDVSHRAFERHTRRRGFWTAAGLRRMRSLPSREPGVDFPVVTSGERVVGWEAVFSNPPYTEIFVFIHLDPDLADDAAAGATALLVDHATGLGRTASAEAPPDPDRALAVEALEADARLIADLEALAFVRDRFEYEMAIDLGGTVPEAPEWPPGTRLVPMRGPEDTDVVVSLLADAFSDHPGDQPFSAPIIRNVLASEDFEASASAIVHDDDGPVGLVLSRRRPGAGYVWVLGVAARARRRGLGSRLLRHSFRAWAVAGTPQVSLDVDGSNTSGALTVYADAGMAPRTTRVVLVRPLSAGIRRTGASG